jgi:hypothetical protein
VSFTYQLVLPGESLGRGNGCFPLSLGNRAFDLVEIVASEATALRVAALVVPLCPHVLPT